MQPYQIISLMDLGGPSFALADHYDHIHVGFRPLIGSPTRSSAGRPAAAVGQPVGPLRLRGSATSTTRSCRPSPRSTRSRSSTSAPASSARARPTWASSRPRRPPASSSGSVSSTSRSRSGRPTAATSCVARTARTSRWSCSRPCTRARASRLRGRRPSAMPPGAVRARAGADHAGHGDRAPSRSTTTRRRANGSPRCGGRGEPAARRSRRRLAHVNRAVAAYRVARRTRTRTT